MKKLLLGIFTMSLCAQINGQTNNSSGGNLPPAFNYQKELERQVKIPNTPEATAFQKYGNTSVSLYTGTPNISIPIYTIAGREINVPITLTYDASGIKVTQQSTGAGLGWNLNAGGRISRSPNGLVDDYISSQPGYSSIGNKNTNTQIIGLSTGGSTSKNIKELVKMYRSSPKVFPHQDSVKQYFYFLKDLSDNKFDTQPDYFSFNALGYSDTFVYDPETNNFQALKNPRTKVDITYLGASINSWVVTTDDGAKFYFEEAETTNSISNSATPNTVAQQEYNSSWVLTKVVSPNGKDTFLFDYKDITKTDDETYHIASANTTFKIEINGSITPEGQINYVENKYEYKQKVLQKITHNGKDIVDIFFKDRIDQKLAVAGDNNSSIDLIQIITPNNGVLKKIKFNHTYFGISNGQNPENYRDTPWALRLKLDRLDFQSGNNTTLNSYSFDYISPESVPSRLSMSQDFLGYYNGASNSVLYPAATVNNINLSGANRNPNFNSAKIGTLSKITYPTGGYTTFTYEGQEVREFSSSSTDVTYGVLGITGNSNIANSDCGNCCDDQYGSQVNTSHVTFKITETKQYQIDYTFSGSSDEAYITKINNTPLDNAPTKSLNEIIEQSSCDIAVGIDIVWMGTTNINAITLDPGTYQITLVKQDGTASVRVHALETSSGDINMPKSGIRIKSIKDYSNNNVLATEKEYKYTTTLTGNISSGKAQFSTDLYTTSSYRTYDAVLQGFAQKQRVMRPTSWSGGDKPHVAYQRVYEIQKNGSVNNGYKVYEFNTGYDNGITTSLGVSYYSNNYNAGKEKRVSIFNKDNEQQTQQDNEYIDIKYYGETTLYPFNRSDNDFYYVRIFQDPIKPGDYRYELVNPVVTGISSPSLGLSGLGFLKPTSCAPSLNYPPYNDCFALYSGYSILSSRQTFAQGRTGGLLSSQSITYYEGSQMLQKTENTYDATIDYLLRETKMIDSSSKEHKTEYFYPKDGGNSALVASNKLTEVVKTKQYKNNNLLSTQQNIYNSIGLPTSIKAAKGTSAIEERMIISYYPNNNVKETRKKDGTTTTYIWGYNNSRVVAKIENATLSSIPQNYIDNIQNASDLDNDRTIDGRNSIGLVNNYLGKEGQLRFHLNKLFQLTALKNAQMTFYTYDPLVGVTSITPAIGNVMYGGNVVYYEYDSFNRLQFVKDKDGNILKENQYNYKN